MPDPGAPHGTLEVPPVFWRALVHRGPAYAVGAALAGFALGGPSHSPATGLFGAGIVVLLLVMRCALIKAKTRLLSVDGERVRIVELRRRAVPQVALDWSDIRRVEIRGRSAYRRRLIVDADPAALPWATPLGNGRIPLPLFLGGVDEETVLGAVRRRAAEHGVEVSD